MTRTRRKYNFPNLIFYKWDIKLGWIPEWHPFHQWECGGNRKYKRYMTKQRRAANKTYTLRELKHCLETYGDIDVTLAIAGEANDAPKGTQYMVTGKEEIIYSNFAKNDDGEEEISLQNFPY